MRREQPFRSSLPRHRGCYKQLQIVVLLEERPELKLKVRGTAAISRIDLVRNNQYIYRSGPHSREAELSYTDREPKVGLNYYYFRIQQESGEVAWASPVWVNYE